MRLEQTTQELITLLRQTDADEEDLNTCITTYFDCIEQTEDEQEVTQSMHQLSQLWGMAPHGSTASLLCGSLVEQGYAADAVLLPYILFFKKILQKAIPLLDAYANLELDPDDEDYDEKWEQASEEAAAAYPEAVQAAADMDAYYLCGVALFSSSPHALAQGRAALSSVAVYREYHTACHWLAMLFSVLIDEPVLVIDLQTCTGFKGRMSGIVDNFQLQLLLMSLPELNSLPLLSEEQTDIVKGYGPQTADSSVPGKWNMYNWEYLTHRPEMETAPDYRESNHWIWSEGIPSHISVFEGYRVVLLGPPSYQRGLPVQRMFKNLEAEILIDRLLDVTETKAWLHRMQNQISL